MNDNIYIICPLRRMGEISSFEYCINPSYPDAFAMAAHSLRTTAWRGWLSHETDAKLQQFLSDWAGKAAAVWRD